MNYRILGMLSVVATVVASLFIYSTTTTNAQTPVDSQTHNHNHNHSHEENGHSHQQSNGVPTNEAVAIPAPAGGPPPLPSEQPSQLTKQGSNSQLELRTDNPAGSIPTNPTSTLGSNSARQFDNYNCPNAGHHENERYSDKCSFGGNVGYCSREAQERQARWTYSPPPQSHSWDYRNFGAACVYNENATHDVVQPCPIYSGSDTHGEFEHQTFHDY